MKYAALAFALLTMQVSPVVADDIKDFLDAVDPDAKPALLKVAADQGRWQHQTEKSALTDMTSVYWQLEADNKLPDAIGWRRSPIFTVMCVENETRAVFKINDYMGLDPITMAYRIDGGAIRKSGVSVSTDGSLFGFWNGTGVAFLRSLKDKSKLVVSANPWGQGPSEAVFNIEGVNAMIADVGKTCGW